MAEAPLACPIRPNGEKVEELTARGMVQAIESTTGRQLSEAERKRLVRGADEEDLVNSSLEETRIGAFRQVRDHRAANRRIPDLPTGAFVSAIEKIARSYLELGSFP